MRYIHRIKNLEYFIFRQVTDYAALRYTFLMVRQNMNARCWVTIEWNCGQNELVNEKLCFKWQIE
jgi:hypothetical protein